MPVAHSTASISRLLVSEFPLCHPRPALKARSPQADPLSLIDAIHERKMKAGVAISPDTPSSAITDDVGAAADMLLVMTVYPG